MSRALRRFKSLPASGETQSWVKAEVATTTERLQSAEDFPNSPESCCHGSPNPWICCTARSTSLTKRTCALVASAPLRRTSPQNRGNLRSASLWWDKPLLNGARFRLLRVRTIPCKSRLGWQW